MSVLVDTSVWSLALRRRGRTSARERRIVAELEDLIGRGDALLCGPVRQELLSGVRDESQWESLRDHLRAFRDLPVTTDDHEEAARFSNRARARGMATSLVDSLLVALCTRRDLALFTTDRDFRRYRSVAGPRLHGV
ncbi:MAG: type II toxin-antitoxin system VapC family toxin [Planctomycetota bacterium]|jgi:predicted nucleic acid-binding protein